MRALSSLLLAVVVLSTSTSTQAAAPALTTPAATALVQLLSTSVPAGARLSVQRIAGLPEGCTPTKAVPLSPLDRSGPAVVDVVDDRDIGGDREACNARVLVDVTLLQPVVVATAAAAPGAPLAAVTAVELREVAPHQRALAALPDGALARRPLVPGRVVVDADLAFPGPAAGEPVKVVLQSGGLRLVRSAIAMPCAGGVAPRQHCARLQNGRQVHGTFTHGVLELQESP
jgi:hypothetical protein